MGHHRFKFPQRSQSIDEGKTPPFLSVSETAQLLGMSEMTLYRAIAAGEFPAVRIRGRLIIPGRAIDQMINAALTDGHLVDAARWVPEENPRDAAQYIGDRGSAPVLPILCFLTFLLVGTVALRV